MPNFSVLLNPIQRIGYSRTSEFQGSDGFRFRKKTSFKNEQYAVLKITLFDTLTKNFENVKLIT